MLGLGGSLVKTSSIHYLAIGDTHQGGIIFYLDGSGGGLIAAPTDQSTGAEWGCKGVNITGAEGTAIGTGAQNTIDILAECSTSNIAADVCRDLTLDGYSDWFLPSRYELAEVYSSLYSAGIGGFASYYYWSSSEVSASNAIIYHFGQNFNTSANKEASVYVRAIRAFSAISPCSPTDWLPTDDNRLQGWWPKSGTFTTNEANSESVSAWDDESVNHNHLVQTTEIQQPSGVSNGVVTFDGGSTTQHLDTTNQITLDGACTIGMIINADETGNYNFALVGDDNSSADNFIKILNYNTLSVKFDSSTLKSLTLNSGTTFANSLYLVITKDSSGELRLYINGTLQDDTITTGISGDLIIDSVGLRYPNANVFKGTMSEIIISNGSSATLTQDINDYLCSIYNNN